MNVKLRIKLTKWTIIVVSWMLIGIWITFYDYTTLVSSISKGLREDYLFSTSLVFNLMAAFIGASLGGAFLVFFVEEKFREKSYGFTLLSVAISFVVIFTFITLLLAVFFVPLDTGYNLSTSEGWSAYKEFIRDPLHIKNILIWVLVVSLTQFFLQINNKFGQGVLLNFIKGKYRSPQIEERIFMFVDLKSSTTIAEQLGNEKYHELLKDFFRDITNSIIYNKGQIYQYVGDEVVISWKLQDGIERHHCLNCFFSMRDAVQKRANKYQTNYGLVPEFKAGLHFGSVIAGEIGVIKRDITFSGDVLNTAARIQSKCNDLGVNFLASKELTNLLQPLKTYKAESLGHIALKGKEREIELCSIV